LAGLDLSLRPVKRVDMSNDHAAGRAKALLFLGLWAGFVALGFIVPIFVGRGEGTTLGAINFGMFGLIAGPLLAYGIVRCVARFMWK
jgi:hypothetical protein